MYTEGSLKDVIFFIKACSSNFLARFAPGFYVKLTKDTGRASDDGDAYDVANYHLECFSDYCEHLELPLDDLERHLKGKVILEYGPGDILGTALLFYAHGAEKVHCVDQFPLTRMSKKNIDVYRHLIDSLEGKQKKRAMSAFKIRGDIKKGFNESVINYAVTKIGLSDQNSKFDIIISRSVLEHVINLEQTMLNIKSCLKPDGVSIHQVDLRSHGLDRYKEYDFLTWPNCIYQLMYSHKGFPNRWRVNKYKELAESSNLKIRKLKATGFVEKENLDIVLPKVANKFRGIDREELSWLGFWVCLEHA